ncbi:MAG: hypothetical protein WC389_22875 [Lutibacter sp.]|jgi:hypothetical protein
MAVLDKFLKRSNADGQIHPLQYYDTSTADMEVVATDKPLPVDIKNADIEINVTVEDIVSVEQSDKTKLKGTMAIDQTTDGTTNKVQARNAIRGDFQVNANIQVGATDVSNIVPLPTKSIPTIGAAITLYNAITATPVSATEIVLGNTDSVKVEISGTSSARTITFAAKLTSTSAAIAIDGYNWSTHTLVTSTTGITSELWEFDGLTGFYSLVLTPTVITGGTLTIKVVEVT